MNIILTKYSWLKSTFLLSIIVLALLTVACSSTSSEEQISVADDQNVSESSIVEVPTPEPTQVPTPEPTQVPTPVPAEPIDEAPEVEIDSCADIPDLDQQSMCEFGLSMGLTIEDMISMAESMGMDPQEMMEMAESMNMDDMMEMAESMNMEDMMEMAESIDMDDMMEMADSMDMDDMMEMADSMDMAESIDMDGMMDMAESMLGEVDDCDAEKNMMKRMMCKMASSMGSGSNSTHSDEAPKLMNLLIQNLGPWDQAKETFGDLKFDSRFGTTIFDDFGMVHNPGQSNEYDNPTFEFKAPAASIVISPVSGVVTRLVWQPSSGYKQDDWEIIISPSRSSDWGVLIDHIVSIDCDRTGTTPVDCDLPLTINGQVISEGTTIEANDVIGYVGNWEDTTNSGINGRTELTLFKYYSDKSGVTNYCPTMHLDESVESLFKTKIQELMSNYETWPGNSASSNQDQKVFSYNQGEMVSPGCKYSAIEEDSTTGVTTPVID